MRKLLIGCLLFATSTVVMSQETFPRNDVKDIRSGAYAFTNGVIVADYQTIFSKGVLLIKDGKVIYAGDSRSIPGGYTVIDLKGKHIYPSFIDLDTNYGIPKAKRQPGGRFGRGPEQIMPKTKGPYNANDAIKSAYQAAENFSIDAKEAKSMRDIGFGVVNTYRADGIARGTSALVSLDDTTPNKVVLNDRSAAEYSFNRGSSRQNYPVSTMGFIALLRQTYLDAQWFGAQNPRPYDDEALEGWIANQNLPQIFETSSWLASLRAAKVGDEFGIKYIISGSGDEYQRIKEIKDTNATFIIPVDFPDAYDVEDPLDAEQVSLKDMKHWELAPTNPFVLYSNKVNFALTTHGLKKKSSFMTNLRKAIEDGLPTQEALKALTYTPARLLNMSNQLGSLSKGKIANFIITSSDIFNEKNIIYENWVQGHRNIIKPMDLKDDSGIYDLSYSGISSQLEISGSPGSHKAKIRVNDSISIDVALKIDKDLVTMSFKPQKAKGKIRLSGWRIADGWGGRGQKVNGEWMDWKATRKGDIKPKSEKKQNKEKEKSSLGDVIYPFVAFGNKTIPKSQTMLFQHATVWTNESDGILKDTDVLIKDGKISKIGKDLSAKGAVVIDATGKHLTAGIIDEHSHIGASSINDVATNSSMVRIGDVIDPTQINIYRSLAGGVTAIQILHGSANPIGGQSALIKYRWGESPENMKIKGADGFIKFALGENVKRSRSQQSIRYPQTRMGVEQVYMDAFSSAREYEKKWKTYNSLPAKAKASAIKPRRDLVDETILEILNGKRFVTCHSYVQSEINMLMHVADKFNFHINTFTHILEGYKVADKMKAHGAGASTFSDWWNYKWEVRYAIPYNATIMHNEGLVVAINSDDSNQQRRLNQEAAKSVKYGGMSEEEAWKMVTLNPAKLLHLDKRMGSIKVGKDADVVLWSDNPLSVYAKAEKTIVDGVVEYDIQKDKIKREEIRSERARLIQKMKLVKKAGGKTQRPGSRQQVDYHCEDINIDVNAQVK